MKTVLISLALFISVSANAQLAVPGSKAPAADNIFFLPTTTVVFPGVTAQNEPAVAVTNPSNRISPTAGQSSVPPSNKAQIYSDGIQAGLQGIVLFTVILAGLMLVGKLKRVHK